MIPVNYCTSIDGSQKDLEESDITIASANLQIDEISDSVIVQSTWPKIFTICSENFSKRLIEMLTKETMKFYQIFV
jgi:hypothetical protein